VDEFKIVLVADGAFNEAHVHAFGIFLHIRDGTVNDLDLVRDVHEKLVEVEEGHVAAGATAEPNCCNF
jgi:hypothetical protein